MGDKQSTRPEKCARIGEKENPELDLNLDTLGDDSYDNNCSIYPEDSLNNQVLVCDPTVRELHKQFASQARETVMPFTRKEQSAIDLLLTLRQKRALSLIHI